MRIGTLVRTRCCSRVYPSHEKVVRDLGTSEFQESNSVGIILSRPVGLWVECMFDGKTGWINRYYLRKVEENDPR